MKTYIYTYHRGKSDSNGNPRHWVAVYRMKRNEPMLLVADVDVGYKGTTAVVCDAIYHIEKGWGSSDKVRRAMLDGKIKLFAV